MPGTSEAYLQRIKRWQFNLRMYFRTIILFVPLPKPTSLMIFPYRDSRVALSRAFLACSIVCLWAFIGCLLGLLVNGCLFSPFVDYIRLLLSLFIGYV
jgi:hypothetical protein